MEERIKYSSVCLFLLLCFSAANCAVAQVTISSTTFAVPINVRFGAGNGCGIVTVYNTSSTYTATGLEVFIENTWGFENGYWTIEYSLNPCGIGSTACTSTLAPGANCNAGVDYDATKYCDTGQQGQTCYAYATIEASGYENGQLVYGTNTATAAVVNTNSN